jgi:hypothetical protein
VSANWKALLHTEVHQWLLYWFDSFLFTIPALNQEGIGFDQYISSKASGELFHQLLRGSSGTKFSSSAYKQNGYPCQGALSCRKLDDDF